jgi:hypothetical protein
MRIILRFRNTMQTTTALKSILMENVDKRVQAFPYSVQFESSIDEFNYVQAIWKWKTLIPLCRQFEELLLLWDGTFLFASKVHLIDDFIQCKRFVEAIAH